VRDAMLVLLYAIAGTRWLPCRVLLGRWAAYAFLIVLKAQRRVVAAAAQLVLLHCSRR